MKYYGVKGVGTCFAHFPGKFISVLTCSYAPKLGYKKDRTGEVHVQDKQKDKPNAKEEVT